MKYISADQFNEADEKVKDSIYNWWNDNISIGDLFESNIVYNMGMVYDFEKQNKEAILGNTTPLLTTQQLIDYIEWRTGYGLEKIQYGVFDCYWVYPYFDDNYSMEQEIPKWYREEMSFCHEELIQALWKCACEVATDEYYEYE